LVLNSAINQNPGWPSTGN